MKNQVIDIDEVTDIVNAMVPVLVGRPKLQVILAVLTVAFGIHNPGIAPDALHQGVEDLCQWMVDYSPQVPKGKMN